jgi:AraC-like DNA-binding protein
MSFAPERGVIALALPLLSEAEIKVVEGVRKALFENNRKEEVIVLGGGYETPLRHLAERGLLVGAIGDFMGRTWLDSLQRDKISFVGLGPWQGPDMACVMMDLETMAKEAIEVFCAEGVASVAFLGPSGPSGSTSLGAVFRKMAETAGLSFRLITETAAPILGTTLRELPLPTGLLCFSDQLARLAIQTAIRNGLQIPHDIAVIGVGNSVLETIQAGIGISSFEPPHTDIGREAGRLMAALLAGTAGAIPIRLAPRFLARESSLRSDSGITRMMSFLRGNPQTDANAAELARIAGMSRRSLEKKLKASLGETPGELLRRIRRERAEKLLKTTDLPITQIARDCGYPEPALFSTAFKRWTGKSPRDFRKTG